MTRKLTDADIDNLVNLYATGEYSVKRLSEITGFGRKAITAKLADRGVKTRSRSEAMYHRMARTSPAERKALASAAHEAVRGMTHTHETLVKRARTNQGKTVNVSGSERIVGEMLIGSGFEITPQLAIDKYNVDIAIHEPAIAVEIFGGNWHASGRHAARHRSRVETLFNCGWHVVCIWVTRKQPITAGCVEQVVALAERIRSNEPLPREELMIGGDGEPYTFGRKNLV